ncbi:hypothetical protein RF11_10360 [Thelohanellus kitauei]|uniref:Uncharacterized protein n=1 Tax=Thelohanellus kitauei TaxID=669202 RepID=A0A0C2M5Q0_THEKT|nr:hypothetical protein RF11_10360 [Thelohanellus kitauei]
MEDIKKFAVIRKMLRLVFENKRTTTWVEINCVLTNLKRALQIDWCRLLFQRSKSVRIVNDLVGYIFILNKDTKYVFSNHYIQLIINREDDEDGRMIMFGIYDLIIKFDGYTQIYNWTIENYKPAVADMPSSRQNFPFEEYGGEHSVETATEVSFPKDEDFAKTEEQVLIDLNTDNNTVGFNQTDANNEINTNNDTEKVNDTTTDDDIHEPKVLQDNNKTDDNIETQEFHEELKYNETNFNNETKENLESNEPNDTEAIDESNLQNVTLKLPKRNYKTKHVDLINNINI